MNPFHLITDSTADLPAQYYKDHQVECMPFTYILEDTPHTDVPGETDLTAFYQAVRQGALPTTTNINYATIMQTVVPLMEQGADVLYVCFSSALTSTYQFAVSCIAELEQRFPGQHFYVVDSRSAAIGQGMVVDYAVKMKERGVSAEEIAQALPPYIQTIELWFMVDSLDHLRRGGRVSKAAAVFGTMVNIKPVLHVDDEGHLVPVSKVRGRKKGMRYLVQKLSERAENLNDQTVYIVHGDCLEDAIRLKAMIEQELGVTKLEIVELGPVVGSHTGAGILAVIFQGRSRN